MNRSDSVFHRNLISSDQTDLMTNVIAISVNPPINFEYYKIINLWLLISFKTKDWDTLLLRYFTWLLLNNDSVLEIED